MPVYKGKLGSLPADIREATNRRLHDGETASQILPWLNTDSRVLTILADRWEGQAITPQNLSEWRNGGYQDWLRQQEKTNHLKTLTKWAATTVDEIAVGDLTGATQRIMAGNLLAVVETMDETEALVLMDSLAALTKSVGHTEKTNLDREKIQLTREQVELRRQENDLNREKFEKQTVEKFLTFAKNPECQGILNSGKPKHVQAGLLRELFFGPLDPKTEPEETE